MNLQTATAIWRSGRGICRFHVRISRVFVAEPNRANGAANRSPAICFVSSNSIRRDSSPAQLDANSGVTNGRRPSWIFLRLYLALPIRRESSPAQLDANSGVANCQRPSCFFEARVKKYQFFYPCRAFSIEKKGGGTHAGAFS